MIKWGNLWTFFRLPPSPILIFILNLCTRGGEHAQGFSLVNTNKNGKALIQSLCRHKLFSKVTTSYVPDVQLFKYSCCSSVNVSISIPIDSSLILAISSSTDFGKV